MREHNAFGASCRAAGVKDSHGVVVGSAIVRKGCTTIERGVKRIHAVRSVPEPGIKCRRYGSQLPVEVGEHRNEGIIHDEDFRFAIVHLENEFGWREACIEGNDHSATPERREHHFHVLVTVVHENGDGGSGIDAEFAK